MHIEEFSHGSSLIHRLDPRVKISSAVLFSVVAALADRVEVLAAALVGGAALVLLARLNLRRVGVRLVMVNAFVLFLWFFLPFSQPGEALFRLGPLTAARPGVDLALAITIKSNAIILAAIALLATQTFFTFIHALRHLHLPDKLIHLFFFTFRYFQVIHQEYLKLRAAMKVRCFSPRTDLHTYRSLAYLVGMVLVKSFDRGERVFQAMLCRGYDGRFWVLDHFQLKKADLAFLGLMNLFTFFLALGQWTNLLR
ncbi:MAG: cobalt ECF transporter T component CbiQ [Pseudomonadota bacterium]